MYHHKLIMAAAVPAVVALAICVAQRPSGAQPGPSVERLPDEELITTEHTVRGTWHFPVELGFATVPIYTTKQLELLGHRIVNVPVRGEGLAPEEEPAARRQIREDLQALLSGDLINDRTFQWVEVVRAQPGSYLPESSPRSPALEEALTKLEPEILYFWALKLEQEYTLQIKGQPREFVSIFVGCERQLADPWGLAVRVAPFLARQNYPEVNVTDKDFTIVRRNEFVRVICAERAYEKTWIRQNDELKRVADPKTFFGISIDVDIQKMQAN